MNTPKYYRLLEKGEIIQEGDCVLENPDTLRVVTGISIGCRNSFESSFFRPVQVDEWIEYAKQKPTKEDFDGFAAPYGGHIEVIYGDRSFGIERWDQSRFIPPTHWRRITPPQSKSKSATVRLKDPKGHVVQNNLMLLQDGTAKLNCGDVISAESIDEFIKARESVMKK